mmetsp:Transcript_11254/g.40634  ORF Transcript_11254/g.40634 Transcript_11254/m.40634 type:complete len:229 (+) Transcript_11254:88-774(+)
MYTAPPRVSRVDFKKRKRVVRINLLGHLGAHRAEVFVDLLNVRDEALFHRGPSELTADPVREHLRLLQPRLQRVQLRVRVLSVHVIHAAVLREDIVKLFDGDVLERLRPADDIVPEPELPLPPGHVEHGVIHASALARAKIAQVLILLHRPSSPDGGIVVDGGIIVIILFHRGHLLERDGVALRLRNLHDALSPRSLRHAEQISQRVLREANLPESGLVNIDLPLVSL